MVGCSECHGPYRRHRINDQKIRRLSCLSCGIGTKAGRELDQCNATKADTELYTFRGTYICGRATYSSITMTSKSLHFFLFFFSHTFSKSFDVSGTPQPAKEWIVCPPTEMAVGPVGATATNLFGSDLYLALRWCMMWLNTTDFPVPESLGWGRQAKQGNYHISKDTASIIRRWRPKSSSPRSRAQ